VGKYGIQSPGQEAAFRKKAGRIPPLKGVSQNRIYVETISVLTKPQESRWILLSPRETVKRSKYICISDIRSSYQADG